MIFKKVLNFFRPNWKKLILLFVFEFLISFAILSVGERLYPWQVYLMSPDTYYLDLTINPMSISQQDVSLQTSIANIIFLAYLYFLSCLIIEGREALVKFFVKLAKKRKE